MQRFYVNAEEEVFEKAAECTYTFPIRDGGDGGGALSGTDTKLYRSVFLVPADSFLAAVEQICQLLGQGM